MPITIYWSDSFLNSLVRNHFLSFLASICQTIRITLKNDALSAQGSLQATYELCSVINGENSWTSTSKAIWYNSERKIWLIGSKEKIGGKIAGVYARRIPGKGPEDDKNIWNYRHFFQKQKILHITVC